MSKIPVIPNPPPDIQKPVTGKSQQYKKKWNFSFKYWKQIPCFGLDKSKPKWFISLLDRLQTISQETVDDFTSDPVKKTAYRYHPIDWDQKNIPVQRKDLNWLHADYLKNEEEFPIVQFQISQAMGRIVGFFDEESTFNIILLDPLHNIQPSKAYNYKVDPCHPLSCEISSLRHTLDKLTAENDCSDPNCTLAVGLEKINELNYSTNVLIVNIDDVDIQDCKDIMQRGRCSSFAEIFQLGIAASTDD